MIKMLLYIFAAWVTFLFIYSIFLWHYLNKSVEITIKSWMKNGRD